MSQRRADDVPPRPEQLAAYADGELGAAAHQQVEAWLASHPEAAAEVDAQRRLPGLCRAAPPPEPGEPAWAAVLARLQQAVTATTPAPRKRRGWVAAVVAVAGAAAALGLVLTQGRWGMPDELPAPTEALAVVPLPAARVADVEIISMDAADTDSLVVGEPPVREPLVLASPGEVRLDKVEPAEDGMVPSLPGPDSPDVPMIVVPLTPAPDKQP
jgi:hypothetical protein